MTTTVVMSNTSSNATTDDSPEEGLDDVNIILSVLIGLVGIVGNTGVLVVLGSSRQLRRKLVNVCLINQSAIDLAASLLLIVNGTQDPNMKVKLTGLAAELYCKIWLARVPMWAMFFASSWSLVVINFERYLSIVFPIFHKTKIRRWQVIVILTSPWIMGIVEKIGILGIPTQFENGYCKIVTNFPTRSIALFALFMNTSLQFFVPLLIILCLYAHMLVTIRRKSRQIAPVTNQHQTHSQNVTDQTTVQNNKMSNVAKNVTKTLMTVTLFFALCWSLNSVYFILAVEGSLGLTLHSQFYYISSYLVCVNQIINPFLYALQYKQFQAQTAKICCRGKCTKQNVIIEVSSTVNTQMTTY